MSQNTPHTKLVGASPIPTTAQQSDARAGVQREKTVDGAGRKVAVVGESALQVRVAGTRATSASFKA